MHTYLAVPCVSEADTCTYPYSVLHTRNSDGRLYSVTCCWCVWSTCSMYVFRYITSHLSSPRSAVAIFEFVQNVPAPHHI